MISFFMSVHPSSCVCVCMPAWNNSAPTGRILIKFYIECISEPVEKIQVSLKSDKV